MRVSIVIPTHRQVSELFAVSSASQQTYKDVEVLVLHQGDFDKNSHEAYKAELNKYAAEKKGKTKHEMLMNLRFFSPVNGGYEKGCGVSRLRNEGVSKARGELVIFIDDDNEFDDNFVEKAVRVYEERRGASRQDCVIIPREMRDENQRTHIQVYRDFSFFLVRQQKIRLDPDIMVKNDAVTPVKLAASNCLIGSKQIFDFVGFDDDMPFVFEDLDMTYRVYLSGFQLRYCPEIRVHHKQREKSGLQKVYLGDYASAYQKGKNRTLFVNKVGTVCQKMQYWGFGLWGHTIFMVLRIIFDVSRVSGVSDFDVMVMRRKYKYHLIWFFLVGTVDGIRGVSRKVDSIYS